MDVDLHHILSTSDAPGSTVAPHSRTGSSLTRFRRARTLLGAVVLFWAWVWLGSASMIASLFHLPHWAMLATYAVGVGVLVSFPLALGAAVQLYLMRAEIKTRKSGAIPASTRQHSAVVVRLPRRPSHPPLASASAFTQNPQRLSRGA